MPRTSKAGAGTPTCRPPATATLLALPILALAAQSAAWTEPVFGSDLRRELMDAVRPIVERDLGAPVVFVVRALRIAGDRGFAWLEPQRPGGRTIRFEETPLAAASEATDAVDGTTVHVLYRREEGAWIAEKWSIGATDVWWSSPGTCAEYGPVIAEYCS